MRSLVTGRVEDVYFRQGEYAGSGAPVVSILPPGNVFVRFFVPETALSSLMLGTPVHIGCDGCAPDLMGTISFIASDAEFTPPVIYSVGNRERLVFKAEARAEAGPSVAAGTAGGSVAGRDGDAGEQGAMTALAIDVHGLTKRFGRKLAVDHVDIAVPEGQVWGFLGPNGSGKTTTIRMLCGLLKPDAGEGTCLGYNIRTEADRIKREVGYMTQRFSYWEDLSIRENLEFVARIYEVDNTKAKVDETLERLGLVARQKPARGRVVGRLEAADGARRVHAARAATAAAGRADSRRRSASAA